MSTKNELITTEVNIILWEIMNEEDRAISDVKMFNICSKLSQLDSDLAYMKDILDRNPEFILAKSIGLSSKISSIESAIETFHEHRQLGAWRTYILLLESALDLSSETKKVLVKFMDVVDPLKKQLVDTYGSKEVS